MSTEALLAAAYALVLAVVAALLELAGRHSHQRSEKLRVAGFRYDAKLDLWKCPSDESLLRAEMDPGRNVVVYRAQAHVCNRCALKPRCTDSDSGRAIEHENKSWLRSEMRRFHRGLSVALLVLASVLLLIEVVRSHGAEERAFLAVLLTITAGVATRLFAAFLHPAQ